MINLATEISEYLNSGQLLWPILLTLVGGFLTALSPCVYPLIPITLSIMGARSYQSQIHGFLVAICYVLGMTIVYASLGAIFAYLGLILGSFMQSKVVLIILGVFFLVMALSLLDFFPIVLPQRLVKFLSSIGGKGFKGAFLMGMVAGLVAAPCTGPVLGFILALIAGGQDIWRGLWLMIAFSLGLGLPFLVLGTFSSALSRLPKSGAWMKGIKVILSFGMICVGVYYIYQALHTEKNTAITILEWHKIDHTNTNQNAISQVFNIAAEKKLPIYMDFYANWCIACRDLDRITFADKNIQAKLRNFYLVKIDASNDSELLNSIHRRFGITGLPTTLIFDEGEQENPKRIFGFIEPEKLLEILDS